MFRIRSLRRTQTAYVLIFAKLTFAVVVSYLIAQVSLSILRKLNDLSTSGYFNGVDEDEFEARWNHYHDKSLNHGKPLAIILFWTKWFDEKPPLLDFSVKRCLPATCHVTADRTVLKHADAIVFHSRDLDLHDLPPTRTPQQLWIFLTLESPFFSGIQIPIWRNISAYPGGMFNWTATYRRDSDVYCPYGAIRRVREESSLSKREPFFENGLKNKSERILWFAGNCHTLSNRELFVDRLKKLYPIDVYGPCGEDGVGSDDDETMTTKLAEKEDDDDDAENDKETTESPLKKDLAKFKHCNTRKNEMECWRTLAQRYKYYLALENSFCRDYITEKFFRPMYYGLLPIVAGGHGTEDYKAIAPEKSFISAFDYNSASEIAALLKKLDKNVTLYNSYFTWRRSHTVEFRNPLCACEICHRVVQDVKRRHASSTFSLTNRIMALGGGGLKEDTDNDEDEDDEDNSLGLLVTYPKSTGTSDSSTKIPTGAEVSRWWHDGACVVP